MQRNVNALYKTACERHDATRRASLPQETAIELWVRDKILIVRGEGDTVWVVDDYDYAMAMTTMTPGKRQTPALGGRRGDLRNISDVTCSVARAPRMISPVARRRRKRRGDAERR